MTSVNGTLAPHDSSRRGEQKRRRFLAVVALMLAVVFTLVSCASIPIKGNVGKSSPIAANNDRPFVKYTEYGPEPNASPLDIVKGFVGTGTGVENDFVKAREYLTTALSQKWSPDKQILVYKGSPTVVQGPVKNSYRITLDVVSRVDATGLLQTAGAQATQTIDMNVVQVEGQWRIADAPDGIMLNIGDFTTLYSPVNLYFYDPTFKYAVPDARWFARRSANSITTIVKAILGGPSEYLKGSVVSAFPTGIELEPASVPLTDSVANVNLSATQLLATAVRVRQQMHSQLLLTLQRSQYNVTDVRFMANNRVVDMGSSADAPTLPVADPQVPQSQVALSKEELVAFDGGKISAISGLSSAAHLDPDAPTISHQGAQYAFRNKDQNQVYYLAPKQEPLLAASGVGLTPPSLAPDGVLWTAGGDGSGTVYSFQKGNRDTHTQLQVPWLVGKTVTTFKVSRDGARALVIFNDSGVQKIALTGINKSAGVGKSLNEPIYFASDGKAELGWWLGETSIAVMDPASKGPVTIQILDLTRDPTMLASLDGAQWLSAGNNASNVHAQTSDSVFTNLGNGWELQFKGLSQASYAG